MDSSKFLDTKEMRHKLSDLKRTIAESTYKSEPKHSQSVYSVKQMIDESKVTLRSSEPYIGGEKETGSRMHRYRNKSRELVYSNNRVSQNRTANSGRLLTSNYNKRTTINKSIDNSSFFHDSTMKILEKSRLETAENIQPSKLVDSNTKIRPVSAYTHSGLRKVGIRLFLIIFIANSSFIGKDISSMNYKTINKHSAIIKTKNKFQNKQFKLFDEKWS